MIALRWPLLALGLGILAGTDHHADCLAQLPRSGAKAPQGLALPANVMPSAGLQDAAEPDTTVAWLSGPAGWPAPSALAVWPDTLSFGGELTLVLDFPVTGAFPADSLVCAAAWWDWVLRPDEGGGVRGWRRRLGHGSQRGGALPEDWPAAAGARLVRQARVYREGPFRLGWDQDMATLTPITWIQGRAPQDAVPLGPADPRGLGYDRWKIAGIVALALIASGLLAWWRRRRGEPRRSRHELIPPPAYLSAAIRLWELHELGQSGEAGGKVFLDRLAVVLRRYLGQRYRIPAMELTAEEIPAALVRLGHRGPHGIAFAELLQQADASRYAPTPVAPQACRQIFARAIDLIEAVKVPARFCDVPASLSVSGEKCWSKLHALAPESAAFSAAAIAGGDRGA